MARLEQLNREKYDRTKSPLFGIRSKRRLAAVLGWTKSVGELERFAHRAENYNHFEHRAEGKSPRPVQHPNHDLEVMHKHIARLLLRIAPPAFLHSGIRKRSFITNAASHVNAYPAVKLDIKRFYPSTLHSHVCGFFKNQMNCAPDVAGLLSSLACVTRNGLMHLPTGSPLSQILAFYSHEKMFSELDEYVRRRRGVFTVYVDDVTASLPFASAADIRAMGRIITKHGLTWHKQRLFRAGVPKLITGAIAKKGRLEAPNRQHFKYARTRDQIDQRALNVGERKLIAKSAIGLIQCIAQIDTRQKRTSIGMAKKLLLKAGL